MLQNVLQLTQSVVCNRNMSQQEIVMRLSSSFASGSPRVRSEQPLTDEQLRLRHASQITG